jgi:hypothetical protein
MASQLFNLNKQVRNAHYVLMINPHQQTKSPRNPSHHAGHELSQLDQRQHDKRSDNYHELAAECSTAHNAIPREILGASPQDLGTYHSALVQRTMPDLDYPWQCNQRSAQDHVRLRM